MTSIPSADEKLIARVVASVLKELGYVDPPRAPSEPEWMPANDVRRRIVQVNRSKFYQLLKTPGFPSGRLLGSTRYLNVREVLRWVDDQEVV